MIILQIPVSKLSKKIILTDYQNDPISPRQHDLLFQQLCYQHPRSKENNARSQNLLTEIIEIKINNNYARRFKKHLTQIGYHLYCAHRQRMLNYVNVSVQLGVNALDAFRNFYLEYNIEEEDYQLETAYKSYQRSKQEKGKKNQSFFVKKKRSNVLTDLRRISFKFEHSDDDIDLLIAHLFEKFFELLLDSKGNLNNHLFKFLCVYIYYRVGNRKVSDLQERFDLTQRQVYYSINKMQDFVSFNPDIELSIFDFFHQKSIKAAV